MIKDEFITIGSTFNPGRCRGNSIEHMHLLINSWEDEYHKQVVEVFAKLRRDLDD